MANGLGRLSDYEEDSDVGTYDALTIDEAIALDFKNNNPKHNGKFNKDICRGIYANLEKGISFDTACLAMGVDPKTGYIWFKKGKKEYESLTDEQLATADTIDELLSDYGIFYLQVGKARSDCIVTIHDMLYERCFENNKEWIGTYILEREEPSKYNLKHRLSADVDAKAEVKGTVRFAFTDGMKERPQEDQDYIKEKLDELAEQYKDSDKAPTEE